MQFARASRAPLQAAAGLEPRIAVLIPCFNEELTVAKVVRDFRAELPEARIYVFDNGSTDRTAEVAARAGAIVRTVPRRGKGNVVQAMFRDVHADAYVIVDGDATYSPESVHAIVEPVLAGRADMVVGSRLHEESCHELALVNRIGNQIFLRLVNAVFGAAVTDLLSGYRSFSRRFVERVSIRSPGFEIETELTIKALTLGFRVAEVPTNLARRPEGSASKIRVVADGLRISATIVDLARQERPRLLFGILGALFVTAAFAIGATLHPGPAGPAAGPRALLAGTP